MLQDAKGDQCDNCGSMLNPVDLINPRCKITGTTPVLRTSKHLFLDLPKLAPELQEYVDRTSELGGWSANCIAVRLWLFRSTCTRMHADFADLLQGTIILAVSFGTMPSPKEIVYLTVGWRHVPAQTHLTGIGGIHFPSSACLTKITKWSVLVADHQGLDEGWSEAALHHS